MKNRAKMDPKRDNPSPCSSDKIPMSKLAWFVFTSRGITHKRLLRKFRRENHGLFGWK